ncbi:hypothetical protein BGX28_007333 [Mortierella sp. GBA30]|nr:hypothetical protein BGX28_007333 [Mortierella sp. GBA30]
MLPLISLDQTDIDRIIDQVPGGGTNVQDIYALSPLQDGILFHHMMAKSGDPYILFVSMSFESRESLDQYLTTVQEIINRHDILRTSFIWEKLSTPAQVVWRHVSLSITELQLDPAVGPIADQLKQMFNPRNHRMDLTQAPLLRFIVAQEGDGRWILLKLLHHLISDHSSLDVMRSEIHAFSEGQGDTLPPAKPYRNLIAQALLGVSQEEHERFFKEMLGNIDNPSLPFGITDVHGDGSRITESRQMLSQDMNSRLRSQAKTLGVSVASLCHVAWALVIAWTSKQQRVVFGTVLFGRTQAATSSGGIMGPFINMLPIRIDLERDSVKESVQMVHGRLASLLEHEHAPLALAQRCSSVAAGAPLFSALLNYRHNSTFSADKERPNGVTLLESQERSNYPFCLSVEDYGSSLGLTAHVKLPFDPTRICDYMQEALCSLANALELNQNIAVAMLEVLPLEERQMLLRDWNATQKEYPDSRCLHCLFEQQVERTPGTMAIVHYGQSLTYSELNVRANCLAHKLIQLGVEPDSLVAICVERSPFMIVGVLAILKAGGAYIPLDPSHASDRLHHIINDTAPICVVADSIGRTAIGDVALSSLLVVDPDLPVSDVTCNPWIPILSSRHLAYVIYTSGTTGKPKGVMVEHQGVVNLIMSRQEYLHVQLSSRATQFFSIAFDGSVCEIFGTLCFGGCLHLLQNDTRIDCQQLWGYLEQHLITHSILPPAVLQGCEGLSPLNAMSKFIIAGESLSANLARKMYKLVPNGTVVNEYGPTETTVAATSWIYSEDSLFDIAPIGRPLTNKTIYLLDKLGYPVPLGAVGELYIGGVGVARGYLNRSDLTAEKFLSDPFSEELGSRMYRTGDLVKYHPDSNLVYMGRNDSQVKIRGFRIELGEIENRLTDHPLVTQAVVVVHGEEGNKRLVAYIIALHETQLEQDAGVAQPRLPEYMIPAAFVRMDTLPLTTNGKLDRVALPAPESNAFALQAYEEPKGVIEKLLSSIWTELLNVKRVGRNDNFFTLGGQSLMAVRMISRLRAMLGLNITLHTLFEAPTIAELAPRLLVTGAMQEDSYDVLLPIKPQGTRPPLFCIHPGIGLSWCYTGLSARLDPDQPLYGLQARGFIGDGMASTLEEMALDYIDQIRHVQSQGPYHLLGYSLGGLIAHTMASYLEKQGENVVLVAMMDTPANYYNQGLVARDDDEYKLEQDWVAMLVGNMDQYSPEFINPFLSKASVIFKNNVRIGCAQAPLIISGDLLVFRATVLPKGVEKLWSPGDWKPYVLGEIEVHDIECQHHGMDLPEPTAIIGRALNQKLKDLHSRGPREN